MEVTPIERNVRGLLQMPFLLIIANRFHTNTTTDASMTEEFGFSVIYENSAVVKTKQLGASDFTRKQFVDVEEQMYVKLGGGV